MYQHTETHMCSLAALAKSAWEQIMPVHSTTCTTIGAGDVLQFGFVTQRTCEGRMVLKKMGVPATHTRIFVCVFLLALI